MHIPDAFLSAIGRVESGRATDAGPRLPWPWTINALGQGHFYAAKAEAIAAVTALRAQGVTSIDVGCLQVNLAQHPDAFASLDQAFDPATNVAYGAQFLLKLFTQTGSWPRAAAAYHSLTPGEGATYLQKVFTEWAIPQDRPDKTDKEKSSAPASLASLIPPTMAMPQSAFGRLPSNRIINTEPTHGPPRATGRDLSSYRKMPIRFFQKPS